MLAMKNLKLQRFELNKMKRMFLLADLIKLYKYDQCPPLITSGKSFVL